MSTVYLAICTGFLFPVFDEPFRERTPDEVDPEIVRGASKLDLTTRFALGDLDLLSASLGKQLVGLKEPDRKILVKRRARQSAMSGIELPADERAEVEKYRRKTPELNGASGAAPAGSGGDESAKTKAAEDFNIPESGAEFNRRYMEWLKTEVKTYELKLELKKKIDAGKASETDRRAHEKLCDSWTLELLQRQKRLEAIDRDYDLEPTKP